MEKQDFVVRFAGEGGQGVVTASEAVAQAAAQVGYNVQTFSTFPSQIEGGPTWTQARVSVNPVLSSGDYLDVLVALNKEGYETHKGDVREGGVIIYEESQFQPEGDGRSFGMKFEELGKSTGNPRAANMVMLGALAALVNWPQEYLVEFVQKRFNRGRANDQVIIEQNIKALELGREGAAKTGFNLGNLMPPKKRAQKHILVKGNDLLSIGALAADVDFYAGYPISPATTILVFMERNLVGPNKFVYQVSSEIEAIGAIAGAGYAGKKSMTATSGPGFSLMHEGVGMAWIMELPLVIVDVQRGGPATGLPTKTEQSDLLNAIHPAHGDAALPVIAPGSVAQCFDAAVKAFEWSERYQGPVILLTEQILAERTENIPRPDTSKVVPTRRVFYQNGATANGRKNETGHPRYAGNGMTPFPAPGGPGAYVANASEHDPMGDTTHLPNRHVEMTERRFNKLKLLEDGTYESENAGAKIALLPWGGSRGAAREAYDMLKQERNDIAWYFTMFVHPLPPKLLEELQKKDLVIVPELNYQGQFSMLLRAWGVRAVSIRQYSGLPFKVRDLVKWIPAKIAENKGALVLK